MEEKTEQRFKEEYKAAGISGKIITIPELAQLIRSEGDKNLIVRKLVEHFASSMSDYVYRHQRCNRIVLGVYSPDWTVDCSDGKNRNCISMNIREISIILRETSEVEVFGVDDTIPDKCYSARWYFVLQRDLEEILLTDKERAKLEAVRLVLAKEKILALFKKGYKSVTPEIIKQFTDLESWRYNSALRKLIEEGKIREENDVYYVLNGGKVT